MQYSERLLAGMLVLLLTDLPVSATASPSRPESIPEDPVALSGIRLQVVGADMYDAAIAHYEFLARQTHWPRLKGRKLLKVGMRHQQIIVIRQRLAWLGDHPLLASRHAQSRVYDPILEQAVRRFQRRHGLKVDGIIGANTRRALSVSPRYRLQQLRINQHRVAEFQQQAPTQYLQVNIPSYHLSYVRDDQVALAMKAIVGRYKRQTPRLASRLETLVLNPDWNVPRGIAYKDIVPDLREDSSALRRKGLQLVEGYGQSPRQLAVAQLDWQRLYLGPPAMQQRFWQPPGQKNPLGDLKFTFPNRHTVYMHGTPDKELFREPIRAYSSGCIRIEQPRVLAQLLMEASGWSEEKLDGLLAANRTRHYRLPQQVPLFLTYWTAWVAADGVYFRHDIYRQDRRDFRRVFPEG